MPARRKNRADVLDSRPIVEIYLGTELIPMRFHTRNIETDSVPDLPGLLRKHPSPGRVLELGDSPHQ